MSSLQAFCSGLGHQHTTVELSVTVKIYVLVLHETWFLPSPCTASFQALSVNAFQ